MLWKNTKKSPAEKNAKTLKTAENYSVLYGTAKNQPCHPKKQPCGVDQRSRPKPCHNNNWTVL